MRARMARSRPGKGAWDIKDMPGGLVDVGFIAQYLVLHEAANRPEAAQGDTAVALHALARTSALEPAIADDLIEAVHLWRRLQMALRLAAAEAFDPATASAGLRELLARTAGAGDFPALAAQAAAVARRT